MEDETKDNVSITVPEGLVNDEIYEGLKNEVMDKKKLRRILKTMFTNGVEEGEDGCIIYQDERMPDISLRDALMDTCNGKFCEKHEIFYKLLRKFNIVF